MNLEGDFLPLDIPLYFFPPLQKIEKSSVVMMDRWHIEVSEQTGTQETGGDVADRIPYNIINNYFSIGVVSHRCLLVKDTGCISI